MAPPARVQSDKIAIALQVAPSFKRAASILNISAGALRARALRDALLRPLALQCLARGKRNQRDLTRAGKALSKATREGVT